MHRANDLAKEQKLNFGDDIAVQLRIARKKRWNIQEEKRLQQEIELQTYLTRLIVEDRDRKIDELRKTGEDVDVLVSFERCIYRSLKYFYHKSMYETLRNLLVSILHHYRSKKLKLKLIDTWMKYIVYLQK